MIATKKKINTKKKISNLKYKNHQHKKQDIKHNIQSKKTKTTREHKPLQKQ